MDVLLSAVLGELTTRSINFFISRSSKPTVLDVADRLNRILLRAQVITNEAMGRRITNQALLLQLDMLRDAMHRGCYMFDTFRYQYHDEEGAKDLMNYYSSLPKVSSLEGLCFSNRNTHILEKLQKALDDLTSMILDVEGLVMFLTSYARLYHEPYSMHLLLRNCMFGRQMEAELVINFLLHPQAHGAEELEVLPIVGPSQVGKSTLVAHVCKDDRVRDHFSEILFFHNHVFADDGLPTFRQGCAMKHQSRVSKSCKEGRLLVVVDLIGDINSDAWNRLYSASKWRAQSGGKILVTSRSDKIVKFGTTQPLSLKYLSHEAYWYFFKTLTFGSMDLEMHPRLARLAMEIARTQNRSFIGANITSHLLRENFDIHFWWKVLTFLRSSIHKHVSKFGEHPCVLLRQNRCAHFGRMATPSEGFMINYVGERSSQEEGPNITLQDMMYGTVRPHGKFEVLAWRSRIPPYYSHVFTCEVAEQKTTTAKRKRSVDNGVTLP